MAKYHNELLKFKLVLKCYLINHILWFNKRHHHDYNFL